MNDNLLFAINIILRIVGGCFVVAVGSYLILNNHPTAGGWSIVGGIFLAGISYSIKDKDEEPTNE